MALKETLIHTHQVYTAYSFDGGGPNLPNADKVYNSIYAPNVNDLTQTIESAIALAYNVIGNGIGTNGLNAWVEGNPSVVQTTTYPALKVFASKDTGINAIYLLVVNRDASNSVSTTVNLNGFTISGNATVRTLNAR